MGAGAQGEAHFCRTAHVGPGVGETSPEDQARPTLLRAEGETGPACEALQEGGPGSAPVPQSRGPPARWQLPLHTGQRLGCQNHTTGGASAQQRGFEGGGKSDAEAVPGGATRDPQPRLTLMPSFLGLLSPDHPLIRIECVAETPAHLLPVCRKCRGPDSRHRAPEPTLATPSPLQQSFGSQG